MTDTRYPYKKWQSPRVHWGKGTCQHTARNATFTHILADVTCKKCLAHIKKTGVTKRWC